MSSSKRTSTRTVAKAAPASSSAGVKTKKEKASSSPNAASVAIENLATILRRRLVKLASPKHADLPRLRELTKAWGVPYRSVVNSVNNSSDFEFKDHDTCKRAVKTLLGSGKSAEESNRRKTLRSLMYTNTMPTDKIVDPKLKPFVEAIKEQLIKDFGSYESKVDESAGASVSASTTSITPLKQVDVVAKESSPAVISHPNPRAPPLKFEPRASTPREETNALDAECLRQRVIELEQRLEQALSDLNKAKRQVDDASSTS